MKKENKAPELVEPPIILTGPSTPGFEREKILAEYEENAEEVNIVAGKDGDTGRPR